MIASPTEQVAHAAQKLRPVPAPLDRRFAAVYAERSTTSGKRAACDIFPTSGDAVAANTGGGGCATRSTETNAYFTKAVPVAVAFTTVTTLGARVTRRARRIPKSAGADAFAHNKVGLNRLGG